MAQRPGTTPAPDAGPIPGPIPGMAWQLTALGALPFLALAAMVFTAPDLAHGAAPALLAYGAVILSFMGGIHWGLAMAQNDCAFGRMILSIVPALVAWIALFLEFTTGFWVLALAFALLFGLDVAAAERNRAPAWYPRLRRPVTILVVACLVLAALSA